MSEFGTFSVCRGVFGHPVFADEPFTEREAWLWLVGQAAFKPHERRVGRVRVKLARGELAHATRFMAEAWKWSQTSVRRFLAKLSAEHMIELNGAEVARITICNYDAYQPEPEKPGAEVAQTRLKEEERKKDTRDDDDTRARATEMADQVHDIFGFDRDAIPPAWYGLQHWLEAGLRSGWKPDLIRLAARKVSANRRGRGPPNNYRYLGPAIVHEHELAAAPVPTSTATVHTFTETNHGRRKVGDVLRDMYAEAILDEQPRQREMPILHQVKGD